MRILRLTAVAVAATAAVLVGPHAASAVQFPGLSISPGSGPSTTSITARYLFLPQQQNQEQQGSANCKKELVTFSWDGHDLGEPVPATPAGGRGGGQGHCVATLTWPLSGLDGPGRHVVRAVNGRASDTKPFTITGTAAPAPVPPPPAASATGADSPPPTSARPSQSAARSSARPSTSASTSAEPLPSEESSGEAGPALAGDAAKPPSGGSIATIVAIVVGVMTIAGGGVLFALVLRRRPDPDEVPGDAVAAEA
jgi:hypothetical protein